MDLNSYRLSTSQMINLMKLVDLGQISIVGSPKRRELTEVHRFIKDYIKYKSN